MSQRLTEDGVVQAEKAAAELLDAPRLSDAYELIEAEQAAVAWLEANGWSYIGCGTTRVVVQPPDDVIVNPYSGSSYVVKLPRSVEPAASPTQRGEGQNRAEWRVYQRLQEESFRAVDIDSFAEVYEVGPTVIETDTGGVEIDHAWLVMEYLPTLRDVYPDASAAVLEEIAEEVRQVNVGAPFSLDAGIDNIGMRVWDASDAPELDSDWNPREWCAFVDYGITNWSRWDPARL